MYQGKAIEGRYFVGFHDMETGDLVFGEIRLKDNDDHWEGELWIEAMGIIAKYNEEHPDKKFNIDTNHLDAVHFALKHRSRDKGFILTHTREDCENAARAHFRRNMRRLQQNDRNNT